MHREVKIIKSKVIGNNKKITKNLPYIWRINMFKRYRLLYNILIIMLLFACNGCVNEDDINNIGDIEMSNDDERIEKTGNWLFIYHMI